MCCPVVLRKFALEIPGTDYSSGTYEAQLGNNATEALGARKDTCTHNCSKILETRHSDTVLMEPRSFAEHPYHQPRRKRSASAVIQQQM